MNQQASKSLYTRDFGTRPLLVLGGAVVVAAVVTGLAFTTGLLFLIAIGVLIVAAGVAGFLTATTHLELAAGHVVSRSRIRERSYDAADLSLEQRGTSNIFVLAKKDHGRSVVCTFSDDDVDHVHLVFESAGVTIVEPEPADPPAAPKDDDTGA